MLATGPSPALEAARLTSWVVVVPGSSYTPFPSGSRSWTYTSQAPVVAAGDRFVDIEVKATTRPSALICGSRVRLLPGMPAASRLIRIVRPAVRSRTNTWRSPPGVGWVGSRFLSLPNAANRPSPLMFTS